jgi:small-conductance mechanosensitive channel
MSDAPFSVGDRVQVRSGTKGTIVAIEGRLARVLLDSSLQMSAFLPTRTKLDDEDVENNTQCPAD